MPASIATQVTRLQKLTVGELRARYAEVFGEQPRSRNKDYLWKRIAFRIQELAEGGVSKRARRRAELLARDADLRVRPPPDALAPSEPAAPPRDPRLPPAGATLKRLFNGKEHLVRVLDDSFEYEGTLLRLALGRGASHLGDPLERLPLLQSGRRRHQ